MSRTRSVIRRAYMRKSAGLAGDVAATLPSLALAHIPLVGPMIGVANTAGNLVGIGADPARKDNKDTDILSLAPGVGQYRLSQRMRRVADVSDAKGKYGTANLVAELLGKYSSGLIGATAGAVAGRKLFPGLVSTTGENGQRISHPAASAGVGAALGFSAPLLVAGIVAAIRRKRTKDEQVASDTMGRAVAKYLVPGMAAYDKYKRLGTSTHYDEPEKKAAEDRSYLRRAALTKAAAVDFWPGSDHPLNNPYAIAGGLGLGLGSGLVGSGLMGMGYGGSPWWNLGKTALGSGLGYIGYKAMNDPEWQAAIKGYADDFTGKLGDLWEEYVVPYIDKYLASKDTKPVKPVVTNK